MGQQRLGKATLVVAIAALSVSAALCVPVLLKMNTDEALAPALAGYVLTPFAVAFTLIVARRQDLKLSMNRGYGRADAQGKLRRLAWLVGLAFIPAAVHVWYIAGYVGSAIA